MNKRIGFLIVVTLLLIVLVGCVQEQRVKVTYHSDPPGGTLYKSSGEVWGECPKELFYDVTEENVDNGYVDVKELEVRWAVGLAKKSNKLIRIVVNETDRMVTFRQPVIEK